MIFTETNISDNRDKVLPGHGPKTDEIIIGGTSTNLFLLWFNFYDYINGLEPNNSETSELFYECEIIYKQGFDIILDLDYYDYSVEVFDNDTSVVTAILTPEQTTLFTDTILDTYVQLKFITVDGETKYTNPIKLNVHKPLDGDFIV